MRPRCIGKWHLGVQRSKQVDWNAPLTPGPNAAGFDYYFGVINSHNQAPFVLVENEKIVGLSAGERIAIKGERDQTEGPRLRDEHALEATQTGKAVAFIEQNKDRPFFLYYPTAAIHDPYTPGKAWQGSSHAGVYGDYIQEFDGAVGAVLAALDRLQLAERTIVVVTSDNGAQDGRARNRAQVQRRSTGLQRDCLGRRPPGALHHSLARKSSCGHCQRRNDVPGRLHGDSDGGPQAGTASQRGAG